MSNQKDDLAGLPTPREGYQWVKVEIQPPFEAQAGDYILPGFIARQVPTPEPEGPEVIDVGPFFRVIGCQPFTRSNKHAGWSRSNSTAHVEMAYAIATMHAKDKANTALLDSFYELGERAEKWLAWHIDGGQDDTTEPECLNDIIDDFVEAYKEAKGDAKQDA